MATQEIRSTDWKCFCDRFERLHRGDLMTVFQITSSGQRTEIARDMPLQRIWFETSAGCSDRIWITLAMEGKREITHEVIDPIHVKLREEGEGSKGLQIDAENGSALLRFSSGKFEELLEGLESD